jgi:hypothetical protein
VARPTGGTPPPQGDPSIIDHNAVALFERIPDRYLTAARNLRVLFADASVGHNISEGLDCLTAARWADSPSYCRRDYYNANWDWRTFTQTDLTANRVPARILFTPSPTRYNRSNVTYEDLRGAWYNMTEEFITVVGPRYLGSKDVLSFQFSYLTVADFSNIASPTDGFFVRKPNQPGRYDISDLEAFWSRNPNKRFFLWTTSLARSVGSQVSTDFNNQVRQYGIQHDMFVLDVADIESHLPSGQECYDNRDSVPYCKSPSDCENYPNDNRNYPAICQDYTTETDGGHLMHVSGGRIRLAKAYWVLMARMAGWDGVSQ